MSLYLIANAGINSSESGGNPPTPVSTGTSTKTLLQIKANDSSSLEVGMSKIKIKEWGISFDGSAAATPIKCELIETKGGATVTRFYQNDIVKFDNYYCPDPALSLSTSGSGYNASNEGTITGKRLFDVQYVAPTNQYVKQFPLGLEPVLTNAWCLRIRVTATAAVNAYCYVVIEE